MKERTQVYKSSYSCCTFDGSYFYFLSTQCSKVYVYNEDFTTCWAYHTKRHYSAICYDAKRNCFWASSAHNASCLYLLDKEFIEFDALCVYSTCAYDDTLSQLIYDYYDNTICIVYQHVILKYLKDSTKEYCIFLDNTACIENVIPFDNGYLIILQKTSCRWLIELDNQSNIVQETRILRDISIYLFLPTFDGYSYMLQETCGQNAFDCQCFSITELLEFLLANDCTSKRSNHESYDTCDNMITLITDMLRGCTHPQTANYNDVIIAVSQIEFALARILQCEGLQMQECFQNHCNIDDALCINNSVEQLITTITKLEQNLIDVLKNIQDPCCCNSNCKDS